MKNIKNIFVVPFTFAVAATLSTSAGALTARSPEAVIADSTSAIEELMANPKSSIPTDLMHAAQCVASMKIIKAGFVFGGRGGTGVVSCRDQANQWSAPLFIELGSANWGLQIGIEEVNLTLVFTNRQALDSFTKGNLTLGAAGGLTAGPVGRDLTAGTNYKLQDAIYSYSRSKGLYAGITLEGSVLSPDKNLNGQVYGDQAPVAILTDRQIPVTVQAYVDDLNRYAN